MPKFRVVGTIASLQVMDVSKRAGVENLKSYIDLEIEAVEPPAIREQLAERARLVRDGKLELAIGARVEVETYIDAASAGPLPIYRIALVCGGDPGNPHPG